MGTFLLVSASRDCSRVKSAYRNAEAYRHREEENPEEGTHASQEVKLVHLPQQYCTSDVDEADHRRYDDRRQDDVGGVVEQRHEK